MLGKNLVEVINALKEKFLNDENLILLLEKLNEYGYFEIHNKNYETKYLTNSILFYAVKWISTILKDKLVDGVVVLY